MFGFIVILRAIATALVANSHFKGVYPNDILSFGGGYGLALFYMISGYLLANINANSSLKEWYIPKLLRLYVPLYIVRIIELLVGYKEISTIEIFLREFIFPGSWFGGSMVFLYLLYFVIVKYWLKGRADYKLGVTITAATICYIALFVAKPSIATFSIQSLAVEKQFSIETPYLITHFIWIVCMFTGYWLRKTEIKLNKNYPMVILLITSILVFLAVRLITRDGKHVNLEFALGPAYVGFALSLFMLLMKSEPLCRDILKTIMGKLLAVISMCSLEIYYIQFMWIEWLKGYHFPINLALLIILITVSAYAVHQLSQRILKRFRLSIK